MVTFLTAGLKEKTESLIHLHFGDSVSVSFKKVAIPAEVKFHAEKKAGLRFMKKHIYTWQITKDDIKIIDFAKTFQITYRPHVIAVIGQCLLSSKRFVVYDSDWHPRPSLTVIYQGGI